jgi:hypothetical protein
VTFYVLHSITRNSMMEGWVAEADRLVLKVQPSCCKRFACVSQSLKIYE